MRFTESELERQRIANERHELEQECEDMPDIESLRTRIAELEGENEILQRTQWQLLALLEGTSRNLEGARKAALAAGGGGK